MITTTTAMSALSNSGRSDPMRVCVSSMTTTTICVSITSKQKKDGLEVERFGLLLIFKANESPLYNYNNNYRIFASFSISLTKQPYICNKNRKTVYMQLICQSWVIFSNSNKFFIYDIYDNLFKINNMLDFFSIFHPYSAYYKFFFFEKQNILIERIST